MTNPFISALRDLGLQETEIRRIRDLNHQIKQNKEMIEEVLSKESIQLPGTSYASVYSRLSNRHLKGSSAREYVRKFTSNIRQELKEINRSGHTLYTRNKYDAICKYYGIDIDTWLSYDEKKRIQMLRDAYYELTGEYSPSSDESLLLAMINDLINTEDE